jgi:molybdopterin synthase catalytic subunit
MSKHFFIEGAIRSKTITDSISSHSTKINIGAHNIFLGQVRGDLIDGKLVKAIEYTAYQDMAGKELERIREEMIHKYKLTCAHIHHSLGIVQTGEICLFVLVSSTHRKAAFEACQEMVELIKKDVPIFGKELFDDGTHQWKENKFNDQ